MDKPLSAKEFLSQHIKQYHFDRTHQWSDLGHILKGKTPALNDILLISNDYLAIAEESALKTAQIQAIREAGNGLMMSSVFLADSAPQHQLEESLAAYVGHEAALVTQSGWSANVSLLQALCEQDMPVYLDMFSHMSLWEGAARGKIEPHPFLHNDAKALAKLIERRGAGIIAVDAIYSTDGSVCPLAELVEVAEKTGSILIVDESHSLGVCGPSGRGYCASLGLESRVHFITSSLAKAFAGRGGFVSGNKEAIEFLRYKAKPVVFSSAILPQDVAGFLAALEVIKSADERRARLFRNADFLRNKLAAIGYNVSSSQTQIIALEAGRERNTVIFRDALERHGIIGAVFCAPATPLNRSMVRLSVNSALTLEQLSWVAEVCALVFDEVGARHWPSVRRLANAVLPADLVC